MPGLKPDWFRENSGLDVLSRITAGLRAMVDYSRITAGLQLRLKVHYILQSGFELDYRLGLTGLPSGLLSGFPYAKDPSTTKTGEGVI